VGEGWGGGLSSFISVDDHVQEHPTVWTDRLPKARWDDRVPHVERQKDGTERWIVDGKQLPLTGVAVTGALQADRTVEPRRWEEVPKGAYQPRERLEAMDAAGIACSVLYPTVAGFAGEAFARLDDPDLELACVQAYNDWLIDEWAAASPRFVAQCIVPTYSAEAATAEIRRAVGRGHRGVVFPPLPMMVRDVPHINEPEYETIWSACQELDVPVCFHAGSVPSLQLPPHASLDPAVADGLRAVTSGAATVYTVSNLLFSKILVRHPRLHVVIAESALGLSTYTWEFADHEYEHDRVYLDAEYPLKPSELFKRQCFYTSWYDPVASVIPFVPASNIMWAANLPLSTSTWPDCQEFIGRSFAGLGDADRQRILWTNAAELYRIEDTHPVG